MPSNQSPHRKRNPAFGSVFTPPIEVKFRDQEPSFLSFVHIGWRQVERERGARRSGGGDLAAGGKFNSVAMVDISILETRLWLACDLLVTRHKEVTSKSQASHKQVATYLWRVASKSQANHKRDLCMYIHIANSFLPSGLAGSLIRSKSPWFMDTSFSHIICWWRVWLL